MAIWTTFFSTVLLAFGTTLFVAGLFGAYYGKGRSRSIGFLLSIFALLVVGVFCALVWDLVPGVPAYFADAQVAQAMMAVLAASIGAVVALVTFVGAVTKG